MTPDEVDAIPYLNERGLVIDHYVNERDEQNMVKKYLPKDARVLELGARYGTVSCLISSILTDPSKHVAVEPDASVLPALIYNKLRHGGKFNIVTGVVSRTPMAFDPTCGYGNYTYRSDTPMVESFTLEEMEKRYDVSFNCLVADCEGFMEQFLKENMEFISRLDMVIFEADCPERCDYAFVKKTLSDAGLKPVVDGFQSIWKR